MLESGQVIDVAGAHARVQITPTASCGGCGHSHSCSGSEGRSFVVEADNPCDAKAGDQVSVDMAPVSQWLAITFVFVVPLVLMFVGLGLGYRLGSAEWAAVIGALVGLLAGFGVLWVVYRRLEANADYQPTVVRVLKKTSAG